MHDLRARERGLETELHCARRQLGEERQKVDALLRERGAIARREVSLSGCVKPAIERIFRGSR